MKYGKIYDFSNAEEARKLIEKDVIVSDYIKEITTVAHKCTISTLKEIVEDDDPFVCDVGVWQFIREIEEESPERMTNKQLAEWTARGFGEVKMSDSDVCPHSWHTYALEREHVEVFEDIRIRPWDSEEWIVPTKEIYETDCILRKIGPAIMKEVLEIPKGPLNLVPAGEVRKPNI